MKRKRKRAKIVNLTSLSYADDTTLVADTEDGLKQLLQQIKLVSLEHGLRLNIKKTKIMTTTGRDKFTLDGDNIEVVDRFMFLGSEIKADGGCSGEIRRRLAMGRAAMTGLQPIIKSKEIRMSTKKRLLLALVFPVVLYGSESWTMTKADRRRVDSFELWCWRRLQKISWTEKVPNGVVLAIASPPQCLWRRWRSN